jgi:2'-5' RNA ligase
MSERTRRTPAQRQAPPKKVSPNAQRVFLAVPLTDDVQALVTRIVEDLERDGWPVRWTPPGNAHITLHFLGNIAPEQVELLRLALKGPVAGQPGFDLRTANLGVFPNVRQPRVLWLGLYGPAHRLETLHGVIGDVLQGLEFETEEREFHPHITLGRLKHGQPGSKDLARRIRERFDSLRERGHVTDKAAIPLPIREVHLMRSHLGTDAARYEVLERFSLGEPIS